MSVITAQPQSGDQILESQLSPEQLMEEEEHKKKERQSEDCCCDVWDREESDIFFLCHCLAWCCRGIGKCTESCFDSCGDCIGDCCNSVANPSGSSGSCADPLGSSGSCGDPSGADYCDSNNDASGSLYSAGDCGSD